MASALPPGPKGGLPGRSLRAFRRDPLGFLSSVTREHGDLALFWLGPQRLMIVNHPDLIKEVLVTQQRNFTKSMVLRRAKRILGEGLLTSEGEFHRRQRHLAQPAFHRQRVAAYATVMTDYAVRMRDQWQPGSTLDLHEEMMHLTLGIVGKTLFDADVQTEADEIGAALTALLEMFTTLFLPFSALLEHLPLPATRRMHAARRRLDATIYRVIDQRRQSGKDHGDLLSMLLLADDPDGGRMSNEQVRDEAMTIFLAGHETTANALTWTWYLLAQHPAAETALHAELDQVLAGRVPTIDDVPALRYTELVLRESMRLYPPAWAVGRQAIEQFTLGGYTIPARTVVVMSQYVTQRDPRWYADPERFDPLRWTAEAQAGLPKFAYFPFGGGPRVCIGEPFAWMEGVLLLATLAQRWQLRLVPDHPVELLPLITLRPKHGMQMTIHQR